MKSRANQKGSVHLHASLLARSSFFFLTLNESGFETRKMRGEEERGGREGRERGEGERVWKLYRDAAHTCSLVPVGGAPGMSPTLSEEERVWQTSEDNRRCLLMGPATNPHPGLREEKGKPKYHLLTACNMKLKFSIEDKH